MIVKKLYAIDEALALVKECASAKFDESIDVAVQLGIDAKKSDQVVRGSVVLPAGTGKSVRVAVFAQGEKAEQARAAGAEVVGMEDLAEQVKAGNLDFDIVIASPDTMRVVGTLGQILGPRGLMPNPKVGTVTPDVATAVKNAKAGQVQFRVDKAGIIHATIGRASFEPAALRSNLSALDRRAAKGEAGDQQGCVPAQGRVVEHDGRWRSRRPGIAGSTVREFMRLDESRSGLKGFGRLCDGGLHRATGCQRPLAGSQQVGVYLNVKPTQMANPKSFVVMKSVDDPQQCDQAVEILLTGRTPLLNAVHKAHARVHRIWRLTVPLNKERQAGRRR